jgi:hypothetical protein
MTRLTRLPRPPAALAALARASIAVSFATSTVSAQQVMDTAFVPRLQGAPAYRPGSGPVVLIDEAHDNFHTAGGRYRPFAKLLEADGFVVRGNAARFDSTTLATGRVLVIANAVSARNRDDWRLPSYSAFDPSEIAAVAAWVKRGGSLLLIADHQPFAGAADSLGSALGVFFANGFAMPAASGARRSGEIVFRRGSGLVRHSITDGRSAAERVDSVVSFTGSAFRLASFVERPAELMRLPAGTRVRMPVVAWQFSDSTAEFRGDDMLQGAVFRLGNGRVAVFGEAAMFSAQVTGPERVPMGMNAPYAAGNPQFVLNTLHWLAGSLTER